MFFRDVCDAIIAERSISAITAFGMTSGRHIWVRIWVPIIITQRRTVRIQKRYRSVVASRPVGVNWILFKNSFYFERSHAFLLSFSKLFCVGSFSSSCGQWCMCVFSSLSFHGVRNTTGTFSVEPPSQSISKAFLCRFCSKKRWPI